MQNLNFEPPEAGDAPKAVKEILRKAYSSCRTSWSKEHPDDVENQRNKEYCARVAWSVVKDAGYEKNKEGRWVQTRDFSDPKQNDLIP